VAVLVQDVSVVVSVEIKGMMMLVLALQWVRLNRVLRLVEWRILESELCGLPRGI